MDSSSIIWSGKVIALQHQTDFPKVVQVEDGHYDENEEMTLSNGDVLTLHMRKTLRTYRAVSRRCGEIRIPTTTETEVKTVNRQPAKIYNTVEDFVEDGVEKVEWLHDTPWLNIKEGDFLLVHEIVDQNRSALSVRMSFMDKNQDDVYVPLNYHSDFKPVIWNTFWLGPGKEEELHYPITVQFIDETLKIKDDKTSESIEFSTIADLGEVTLKGFEETEVFIASIKDEENRIIVMKIPTTLDITVRGGVGITDDDYTYVNVCQEFNRRARLEHLDENILNSVKIGDIDATVERIYEVPDADDDDEHEYIEPAPILPSRIGREPLHNPTQPSTDDDDDNDDDEDEYEECPDYEVYNDDNDNNIPDQQSHVTHDASDNQTGCCCFKTNTNKSSTYVIQQNEEQAVTPVCTTQPMRYIGHPEYPIQPMEDNKKDYQIPTDLEHLSTDEVLECLKYLNMVKHVDTFKHSQINGELLVTLDEDMLGELGVISTFEKRKLIKFIQGWRPESH